MIKVIFLDVDGPLNTDNYLMEQCEKHPKGRLYAYDAQNNFDPNVMRRLQEISKDPNTKIVVSSSWRVSEREFKSWKKSPDSFKEEEDDCWFHLMRNLNEFGLRERVIGVTRRLWSANMGSYCQRGIEIKDWLERNKNLNIISFVIIDDSADMCELTETHLAKCKCEDGITEDVMNKAIEILSRPNMIES